MYMCVYIYIYVYVCVFGSHKVISSCRKGRLRADICACFGNADVSALDPISEIDLGVY